MDLRKKGYPEKIKKIFVATILTIIMSNITVLTVGAIDSYNLLKDLYKQSYIEIDKSDAALGISQTTITEVYTYEETSESTIETTEETTTVVTPTLKPEVTKTVVKATPTQGITPIHVDVNSLPKFKYLKVAVFGINQGLADSFKIISVDNTNKVLKIASEERDIKCLYYGKEYKMNELYGKLGPTKFLAWFNATFHTDIREFIVINYEAFIKSIDAIGGIEVDVSEKDRLATNKLIKNENDNIKEAGVQMLNGDRALQLIRSRKQDSDVGRSKRQDVVIQAVIKKLKSYKIEEMAGMLKLVLPYLKWTLSPDTALSLAWNIAGEEYKIETRIFPSGKEIIKDGLMPNIQGEVRWYIEINKELMTKNLNWFLN